MLDSIVEELLICGMAPSAKSMRAAAESELAVSVGKASSNVPLRKYLVKLVQWYANMHSEKEPAARVKRQRRDQGVERIADAEGDECGRYGGPCSNAALAMTRSAAVEKVLQASAADLEDMRKQSVFGDVARAAAAEQVAPSAVVLDKLQKKAEKVEAQCRQPNHLAKAKRDKYEATVIRASTARKRISSPSKAPPWGSAGQGWR